MHEDLANLTHHLLQHGIELKKRLLAGEKLDVASEQAVLKRLLLTDAESRRIPEYGEEADLVGKDGHFLGVRYALVCWLDELFLVDSPWEVDWNETKLEMALYGSNDRAWRFWDQAKIAERRPTIEALRAFYLCAMLGFRGDLGLDNSQLRVWVESVRRRLGSNDALSWSRPPERELITYVPPLRGQETLRRMIIACGTLMLVVVPLIAIFLVQFLNQNAPTSGAVKAGRPTYGKDQIEVTRD